LWTIRNVQNKCYRRFCEYIRRDQWREIFENKISNAVSINAIKAINMQKIKKKTSENSLGNQVFVSLA
jgi:hypothetical protein